MILNFQVRGQHRSFSLDVAPDTTVRWLVIVDGSIAAFNRIRGTWTNLSRQTGLNSFDLYKSGEKKKIPSFHLDETIEQVFPGPCSAIDIAVRRKSKLSNILSAELSRLLASPAVSTKQDSHLFNAIENFPESFGQVSISGKPYCALVDTGAQSSIICSSIVLEDNKLAELVDKRFKGVASGVGQSEILGRIHSVDVTLWHDQSRNEAIVIPCGFHVLEMKKNAHVDLILGLDTLRRHQITIDLEHNVLIAHGFRVKFLSEWELPPGLK